MNSVNLIGSIHDRPFSQDLPDGKSVTHCVLAVEDRHRGILKRTIYIDLIFWTPMAEIAIQRLRVGQRVAIIGRLTKSDFIPKGGTQPISKLQIIVVWWELLDAFTAQPPLPTNGLPQPHPN